MLHNKGLINQTNSIDLDLPSKVNAKVKRKQTQILSFNMCLILIQFVPLAC